MRKKIKFYENNKIKINNNKKNINNKEYELKMSNLEMLFNSYGEKLLKLKKVMKNIEMIMKKNFNDETIIRCIKSLNLI